MSVSKPSSSPFPAGMLDGLLMGAMPERAFSSWDEANVAALEALNVGQTEPLAALLAGGEQIHPEVRLLIAETLNAKGKTPRRLKFVRRRGHPAVNDIEIGAAVIALIQDNWKVEAAVAEVMRRTDTKRSKVFQAYSDLKDALERIQSRADSP